MCLNTQWNMWHIYGIHKHMRLQVCLNVVKSYKRKCKNYWADFGQCRKCTQLLKIKTCNSVCDIVWTWQVTNSNLVLCCRISEIHYKSWKSLFFLIINKWSSNEPEAAVKLLSLSPITTTGTSPPELSLQKTNYTYYSI